MNTSKSIKLFPCSVCTEGKTAFPDGRCENCGCDSSFINNLTPPALRYNSGKPQYSLLDMEALEPLVRVLEFGAKKYTRNNWKRSMNMDQLMDSMLRHVAALQKDPYDSESGIHHIGHILANAMFYSYHLQRSGVPLRSENVPNTTSGNFTTRPLSEKSSIS